MKELEGPRDGGAWFRAGRDRANLTNYQVAEKQQVTIVIRKLDKHTLNMYISLGAGLGTRELSRIHLGFREIRAKGTGKRFQEEWQQ